MKKSIKINLKDATILSGNQMKKVYGGSGPNGINLVDTCPAKDKISACTGKSVGDTCCWKYNGSPDYGTCQSYLGQALHCSDLG